MRLEYDTLTKHLAETETSLKDALSQIKSKVNMCMYCI